MSAYGHHFHKENSDARNIKQDCGVEVEFDQSSRSNHHDQNLVRGMLGYVEKIQEIIEVGFLFFPMCYF